MIRGIVLPQPDATLIASGIRKMTRHTVNIGREFRIGERIAIVSAKELDVDRADYQFAVFYPAWVATYGLPLVGDLPLRSIVGSAVFAGCVPLERAYIGIPWRDQVTEDWYTGKGYAARWRDPFRFENHRPVSDGASLHGFILQLPVIDQDWMGLAMQIPPVALVSMNGEGL